MRSRSTANQPRSTPPYPGLTTEMNAALTKESHIAYSLARRMGAQRNNEQIRVLRLEMFTYAASIGLQVVLPWTALTEHYPVLLQPYMDNIATHFHARYGWDRELCEELLGNIFVARELRRAAGLPSEEGYDQIISARPGPQTARAVEPPVACSMPAPLPAVSPAAPVALTLDRPLAGLPEAAGMAIDGAPALIEHKEEAPDSVDEASVIFEESVQDLDFLDPASIAVAERQLGLDAEYEPFSQQYADVAMTDETWEQPTIKPSIKPIEDLTALYPKPTYFQPPPMLHSLKPRATTEIIVCFGNIEGFVLSPRDNYDVFLELIRNRTVGLLWSPDMEKWYKLDSEKNYEGMWLILEPGATEIFLDWQKYYPDIVLEGNTYRRVRCYGIGIE